MRCHEVDYEIYGDDMQVVEVELDPEETVIAEAGAMNWMEDGIQFEARMGDGSKPNQGLFDKLMGAAMRTVSGESIFMTHFTNISNVKRRVAFAAPYPGTVIPIDLSRFWEPLIVQKDGFLCAAFGTRITLHLNRRIGSGLVGGEGFILQRLEGNGKAFVHAGGTVIEKDLDQETLRIDTGCIVAFESRVDFTVETAGSLKSMVFGGEGLFLATLRGPGKIWLQSMPFRKLIQAISPYGRNVRKGSSSILGNLLEG